MFTLPNDVVKKIIQDELDYDGAITLPITEEVKNNEIVKGHKFEDQAKRNLSLEQNYTPICSVLEEKCKKQDCVLFHEGNIGKIGEAWVCREYKVDFPEAPFDSRYHVPRVGVSDIDFDKTLDNFKKFKEQGAKYVCLGCNKPYETKRTEPYEDGHGGRMLEMCVCGSDLFEEITHFIERHEEKIKNG